MSNERVAQAWSKRTEEHVGWYVYVLLDPRDRSIFYIGKGQGNRAFEHAYHASHESSASTEKINWIREIQASTGSDPEIIIVRHQLPNEAAAYEVEAALIDYSNFLSRVEQIPRPSNVVVGRHSHSVGLMNQVEIEAAYAAVPLLQDDFCLPALAFRIPRRWTPAMTADELYEATHGWWRLGTHRENGKYALAVSRGVIRAIFSIDESSWRERQEGDRGWRAHQTPRWGFTGSDVSADFPQFVNRDISEWFTHGSRSPVMYVNC